MNFFYLIDMVFFFLFWAFFAYLFYFLFSPKRTPITEEEIRSISLTPAGVIGTSALILAYNFFLYETLRSFDEVLGIGFGLFSVVFFLSFYFVLPAQKRSFLSIALCLLGSLSGLSFAFRANEAVLGLNAMVLTASSLGLMLLYVLHSIRWEGGWLLPHAFRIVQSGFRHAMVFLKALFQFRSSSKSKIIPVFKTVLFTFIVLVFFTGLLTQADPIFEALVEEIQEEAFTRLFASLFLAGLAIFFLTLRVSTDSEQKPSLRFIGVYELAIPVLALEILFLAFLSIQAQYLFGSHENIAQFDLTYSEYVRKGFMELLATTFFASGLSYLLIVKQKTEESVLHQRLLKGLNVALVFLLLALLASALQRDLIYVEAYGLTRIRFAGMILLASLAALLGLLFSVTTIRRFQEKHLWGGVLGITVVAFLTLNAINMDRLIILTPPPEGQVMDYFYAANLSTDAAEGWPNMIMVMAEEFETLRTLPALEEGEINRLAEIKLAVERLIDQRDSLEALDSEEPAVAYSAKGDLYDPWYSYGSFDLSAEQLEAERHWTSFNWSKQHALAWITQEAAVMHGTLECLQREIRDYQLYTLTDLYEAEWSRLYDYEYPLLSKAYSYYYPRSFSDLIQTALQVDAALKDQAILLFGDVYLSLEDLKNGDPAFFEELKALHTPDSCKLSTEIDSTAESI